MVWKWIITDIEYGILDDGIIHATNGLLQGPICDGFFLTRHCKEQVYGQAHVENESLSPFCSNKPGEASLPRRMEEL